MSNKTTNRTTMEGQTTRKEAEVMKDMALAAVVRTFFKYFILGLIEGKEDYKYDATLYEPKSIKKVTIDHFNEISEVFNQEAFYAISRINYIEEEIETELKKFISAGNSTSPMELMRFACKTADFYSTMVSEYKRNFEALLCGTFAPLGGQDGEYTKCDTIGTIEKDLTENIVNRIANKAYEEGKKRSK